MRWPASSEETFSPRSIRGAIGSLGNGIPIGLGTALAEVVNTDLSANQVVKGREASVCKRGPKQFGELERREVRSPII